MDGRVFLLKVWFRSFDVLLSRSIMEELGIMVKSIEHYPSNRTPGALVEVQLRIETAEEYTGDELVRRIAGMDNPYNGDQNQVMFAYNKLCEDRNEHILEQYGIEQVAEIIRAEEDEAEAPAPEPKKHKPASTMDEYSRLGMQVCGLNKVVKRVAAGLAVEVVEAIRKMEQAPMDVLRLQEENARLKLRADAGDRSAAELEDVKRDRDEYVVECAQAKMQLEDMRKAFEDQRKLTERVRTLVDWLSVRV